MSVHKCMYLKRNKQKYYANISLEYLIEEKETSENACPPPLNVCLKYLGLSVLWRIRTAGADIYQSQPQSSA